MKRVSRVKKQIAFSSMVMLAVAVLAGVAWADPSGLGDVPQIGDGVTSIGLGNPPQATFLATDFITFSAFYYDNNAACSGVAPTFVQLFVFNSEGVFVQQFNAVGDPSGFGPKYRLLVDSIDPLPAGNYKFTFLVRDCANTKSVVLPEFLPFRVIPVF